MAPLGGSTHPYLDGVLRLWRADRNPLWIWYVIKTCIENGDPFPADAIKYLSGVADRLLPNDAVQGEDIREVFRDILGFKAARGREAHALRAGGEMVENEKFAVRYAVQILDGQPPSKARAEACLEEKVPEDRTLQTKVKKFFGVARAPSKNAGWRKIIILWMIKNFNYPARYPELPPLTLELIHEVIDELPHESELNWSLLCELSSSSRPNFVNSPRADATPGVSSNAMVSHAKKITRPRRP